MSDRLKEIREQWQARITYGQPTFYDQHIEYLLSEVERLQSANNAIMGTIMNDFYATQFQTLGQYRSALIKGAKQALNQESLGEGK